MYASCGDPNTEYEANVVMFSISYFLYDFVAMMYYGLLDATMVFHHTIVIMLFTGPFSLGMGANYIIRGMFVTEVSNPMMHARCILKHYGLRYSLCYETMEISFAIGYIFGRIIVGTGLLYTVYMCPHNHPCLKHGFMGLYLQSIYFTVKMIGILKKRFREIHNRKI